MIIPLASSVLAVRGGSSVRTLALLRGKVWNDGREAGRPAGWVIRAAEEIEHFNKTRFNIYLQVNAGRISKGRAGTSPGSCLGDNLV